MQTTQTTTRTASLTAASTVSTVAALTLVACSSSTPEASGPSPGHGPDPAAAAEYQFIQENFGPYKEVSITIPDEILAESSGYMDRRKYNGFTVRGLDIPSPKFCGIEVDYAIPDKAWEQQIEFLSTYPVPLDEDGYPNKGPQPDVPEDAVKDEANKRLVGTPSGAGNWGPPDLDNPAKGEWHDEEKTRKWVIGNCATSTDGDTLDRLVFNTIPRDPEGVFFPYAPLATAKVGAMNNGEVFIQSGQIEGWEQDSNGDWIPRVHP